MTGLRTRISAAAQELYLREVIEGFPMRKVAELVGVSARAIYRHFKNKDELLNEIVIEGLKILESYLRPALESGERY
jgi:AcrR family transcriptional regulator